jgi:hypothetical protein
MDTDPPRAIRSRVLSLTALLACPSSAAGLGSKCQVNPIDDLAEPAAPGRRTIRSGERRATSKTYAFVPHAAFFSVETKPANLIDPQAFVADSAASAATGSHGTERVLPCPLG